MTEAWLNPPITPLLKVYVFNFTNPSAFLSGAKPELDQVGPFVYEERWSKVDVKWSRDGKTVDYRKVKTFGFRRDLSVASDRTAFTTLNVPMISALTTIKYESGLVGNALNTLLKLFKQEAFEVRPLKELLWGYDNPLVTLAKDAMPEGKAFPHERFGYFVGKNGTKSLLITASTGVEDVDALGQVRALDGKKRFDFWNAQGACNDIRGTDGSLFKPGISEDDVIYIVDRDLCRSLPLVFEERVVDAASGIPAMRFAPPSNVFSNTAPENACFKGGPEDKTPSGLFNVSSCQFGSPIMLSWPHFYQVSKIIAA